MGQLKLSTSALELDPFARINKLSGHSQMHPDGRARLAKLPVGCSHRFHRVKQPLLARAMGNKKHPEKMRITASLIPFGCRQFVPGKQLRAGNKTTVPM